MTTTTTSGNNDHDAAPSSPRSGRSMLCIIALMGSLWSLCVMSVCWRKGQAPWIAETTSNPRLLQDFLHHFSCSTFLIVSICFFIVPFGTLRCFLEPSNPVWEQHNRTSSCFFLGFTVTSNVVMTGAKVWFTSSLPCWEWLLAGTIMIAFYGLIVCCAGPDRDADDEPEMKKKPTDEDDLHYLLMSGDVFKMQGDDRLAVQTV